jgi:hypothetical protein
MWLIKAACFGDRLTESVLEFNQRMVSPKSETVVVV